MTDSWDGRVWVSKKARPIRYVLAWREPDSLSVSTLNVRTGKVETHSLEWLYRTYRPSVDLRAARDWANGEYRQPAPRRDDEPEKSSRGAGQ